MTLKKFNKWDIRFFNLTQTLASWSEDQSRKVGCVIVGEAHEIRGTGYNGLPRGVSADVAQRHSREAGQKYLWYEHAERNAIYNMVRVGTPSDGCIMYCNWFPCATCARAIVQAGLKELRTFPYDASDPKFGSEYAISAAILGEGGVLLSLYEKSGLSGPEF